MFRYSSPSGPKRIVFFQWFPPARQSVDDDFVFADDLAGRVVELNAPHLALLGDVEVTVQEVETVRAVEPFEQHAPVGRFTVGR